MNLVVDASVALKWFVVEDDSLSAIAVRTEHNLVAPDFLLMECRNALLNKVRRREISVADAERAERDIDAIDFDTLPSVMLLRRAFTLALELGEPIYDCIYLAAAVATDRTLVTADERFVAAVAKSPTGRNRVVLMSDLGS